MSNDMRIVKFKMKIRDIWEDLERMALTGAIKDLNDGLETAWLATIYDYDKLNDYGKAIMDQVCKLDKEEFCGEDNFKYRVKFVKNCKNIEYRMKAAKVFLMDVVSHYKSSGINLWRLDALYFMFWSLMILAVDDEDKEEYLSLICDFAKILKISDEEMMDLVRVIRIIYQVEENIDIQTKDIKRWFAKVVGKYCAKQ